MTASAAPAATHERALLPLSLIVLFGFFSIGIPLAAFPAHVHGTLGFGNSLVFPSCGVAALIALQLRNKS